MTEDIFDKEERYCPKLGHTLNFAYCRKPGQKLFCSRIFQCWGDRMDINAYIKEFFKAEEIREAFNPPKPKIVSLYELIQKNRSNTGS